MHRVKVFLVDDSTAVRALLTQILEEDPGIEIVGSAPDGHSGLSRLARVQVDVLVLDVEMPGMGGIEMLDVLARDYPALPVLLFSSMTERGAMITIEALSRGARDYVTKPAMMGSANAAREYIRSTLLPRIHSLGETTAPATPTTVRRAPGPIPASSAAASQHMQTPVPEGIDAVVIGISMGGPKALGEIIPELPASLPVPVLIVQHMPALFTKALANRLNERSAIEVHECGTALPIKPGHAYLAAGGFHMVVEERNGVAWAVPDMGDPVNFCRPAADILFRSAADIYHKRLLAVVMTGMGQDGLDGARYICSRGGHVLAQDKDSSAVWGMAGSVVRAGLTESVLPLSIIPEEIVRRASIGRSVNMAREGCPSHTNHIQ